MEKFLKRTWAEINCDNLYKNLKEIKSHLNEGVRLMAIVKADAYGHGLKYLIPTFEKANTDLYGVSNIEEAIDLRKLTDKPILILGFTPPNFAKELAVNDITQAVFSFDYAKDLQSKAQEEDVKVKCHFKIDTGMNRIGFQYFDAIKNTKSVEEIVKISKFKNLNFTGIFTHFAESDNKKEKNDFTQKQYNRFCQMITLLEKQGIYLEYHHCCNSAGIFLHKDKQLDTVRAGITMYGLSPDVSLEGDFNIKPVMTLKSAVAMIKSVPSGSTIGYGRTYKAEEEMKVATIPVGYADGYDRGLSNKGEVLIKNKLCKIVGRVCMDQIMVDVSDVDVKVGDEVILFGDKDFKLSADKLAQTCDTIGYELVSNLGKRVPLIFISDNMVVNVIDYYNR
jgi:alanine racemase